MIPVGGRTSYAGDVLAIVVAETPAGAGGCGVGRRELRRPPPITDPLAAIQPGAEIAV